MRSGRKKSAAVVSGSSDFDSPPPENADDYGGFAAEMPPITDAVHEQRKVNKGKEPMLQETVEEFEEDGDEYYEGGEEEADGDGDDGEKEEEEGADERPKLPEGFYEIEAIRGKRKRKNVTQYLIKWRGWPESANTWEPLENLQPCYDFIESFEISLQSSKGKRGRKPKRKHGATSVPQSKEKQQQQQSRQKKQQHSPAAATYSVPLVRLRLIEDPLPPAPQIGSLNVVETDAGEVIPEETSKQGDENGTVKGSSFVNLDNSDDVFVHVQEQATPEGATHTNGVINVNGYEANQTVRRSGARRRKSSAVKRFKPDSSSRAVDTAHDAAILTSCTNGIQNDRLESNKVDSPVVTEIIKAIEYSVSASDNTQDVAVTFMVMRSDGSEVLMSNKYLKAHYPLLLINYYEQRLRFSPNE